MSVLPKNITQCRRPGFELGPPDPETSALTVKPPRLPPRIFGQFIIKVRFLEEATSTVINTVSKGKVCIRGRWPTRPELIRTPPPNFSGSNSPGLLTKFRFTGRLRFGNAAFYIISGRKEPRNHNFRKEPRKLGCHVTLLSPSELKERFPLLNTNGITLASLGKHYLIFVLCFKNKSTIIKDWII